MDELCHTISRSWRQTLSVAAAFWGTCLVLVAIEASTGSGWVNNVVGVVFFLSVPVLVACLTWTNRAIVFRRPRRGVGSVLVLGVAVLASATLILLLGLLAAANLKSLLVGI